MLNHVMSELFLEFEEIEELNMHVLQKIITHIKNISEKICTELPKRDEIRQALNIKKITVKPSSTRLKAYYIDGSYSEPAIELLGGSFIVYAVGYISNDGVMEIPYGGVKIVNKHVEISRYVSYLEHKLAIKLLREKLNGIRDFDIIIHDGCINNFPGEPFDSPKYAVEVLKEELKLAKETNTIIVGIPKTTRAVYTYSTLNIKPSRRSILKTLPDRTIASYILDKGEYVVLGKLKELLPKYAKYIEEHNLGKVPEDPLKLVNRVSEYGDIGIVLFKTLTGHRLEIYDPTNQMLEDVLAYLYWECGMGKLTYPYMHDRVDQLVRVKINDTVWAYTTLLKNITNEEIIKNILIIANPQKVYLYRRR